ncbi:uncharacterized protein LOC126997648 isoform X1 [Eriocheir sinensis]|uniref:uncharacterized protein LOC126997648 isoform X1 n=1 Tax=Eriocheir sinensis TaxID=95602 RepID=UPI0021CA5AA4|nr:uncharacterized protein LOC126997648 isoform X1 [Eriocheir sinensis]XP_050714825.1 uncharacterized protein LOC126997648 isoform X1 [Eriocheir sinensis]
MNTSTLLGRPLLLVVVLAVSWAAAVPLQAVSGKEDLREDPETFLRQHPSIARELYPDLLNAASEVNLILNRDVAQGVLRNYLAEEEIQPEEEHVRRRRDTTLSGSVDHQVTPNSQSITATGTAERAFTENHSIYGTGSATRTNVNDLGGFNTYGLGGGYIYSPNDNTDVRAGAHRVFHPNGGTTTGVSGTLEHSWDNNHSVSAGLEANRHDNGFNTFNTQRGEVSYNYSPNRDTTLSIDAHRSYTPFGRDNGFGLNFIHRFGG